MTEFEETVVDLNIKLKTPFFCSKNSCRSKYISRTQSTPKRLLKSPESDCYRCLGCLLEQSDRQLYSKNNH